MGFTDPLMLRLRKAIWRPFCRRFGHGYIGTHNVRMVSEDPCVRSCYRCVTVVEVVQGDGDPIRARQKYGATLGRYPHLTHDGHGSAREVRA